MFFLYIFSFNVKNLLRNTKKGKTMKNLLSSTLILLFSTLFIIMIPTDAEAKIYDDTLRLHILANSDTEVDQELKIEIRDLLLEKYGDELKKNSTVEDAIKAVDRLIPSMENDVSEWIRARGFDYSVRITLTEEWYDTRNYESYTLPAGLYNSLRVIIGSGNGKNWWCVMYPPLCLELACENAPEDTGIINYTKEEIRLINGNAFTVKFKILELLSDAFAKNG
jgi:stage II sporulation protein R